MDMGDRRGDIDTARIGGTRRTEQGDVTGRRWNARDRTGIADGVDAALVFHQVAGRAAGAEQEQRQKGGETEIHGRSILCAARHDIAACHR